MDEHRLHAERVGNQAGVRPARATEAAERVAGHIVAALHGDFLDRVRHVLDGDLEEAVGDLGRAAPVAGRALDLGGEVGALPPYDPGRQLLVPGWSSDGGRLGNEGFSQGRSRRWTTT